MCQLTLVNFPDYSELSKLLVRPLVELNATAGNYDGHGFMRFDDTETLIKSKEDAESYWIEHEEEYEEYENMNGMFHVRAASGVKNNKTIIDENSHPFRHGDVTVIHNGTLGDLYNTKRNDEMDEVYDKFEDRMIDSEKFTVALSHYAGKSKVNISHIRKATECFYGPFAFIIYDIKQPKKVFLVVGQNRFLNYAKIIEGDDVEKGNIMGTVINTGGWELLYVLKFLKTTYKKFTGLPIKIVFRKLKEESVYSLNLETHEIKRLGDIKERVYNDCPSYSSIVPAVGFRGRSDKRTVQSPESRQGVNIAKALSNLAYDLNLTITEMWVLSELLLEKNLSVYTSENMEMMFDLLREIDNATFNGRIKEWINSLDSKNLTPMVVYEETDIPFPYLLESKNKINRAISKAARKADK